MWKITNVSHEVGSLEKLRRANGLVMSPTLAGKRLHLRSFILISDEDYKRNKAQLAVYESHGVVRCEKVGQELTTIKTEKPFLETPVTVEIAPAIVNVEGLLPKMEEPKAEEKVEVAPPAIAAEKAPAVEEKPAAPAKESQQPQQKQQQQGKKRW